MPAAPLFQVQIRALVAPAGTACVAERSAYAVRVICRLISLISAPDELEEVEADAGPRRTAGDLGPDLKRERLPGGDRDQSPSG